MTDTRLTVICTSIASLALIVSSCVLILFDRGGTSAYNILGLRLSSPNIGLAVLIAAISILVYVVRDLSRSRDNGNTKRALAATDGVTWDEVLSGTQSLILQLTSASGFRPDLVIGVCGGGLIVADIIGKRLGHIPCLALWPDRHNRGADAQFDSYARSINAFALDDIIEANAIHRILLVDDVVYSGETLRQALEFLRSRSKRVQWGEATIRTAALFVITDAKYRPDFFVMSDPAARKMMPVSDRLRKPI